MTHELDRLGGWEDIVLDLGNITDNVTAGLTDMAPCQSPSDCTNGGHIDCPIFTWLGYSLDKQPSKEEYAKVSKIIQAYLTRFEPSHINWDLIKELVKE